MRFSIIIAGCYSVQARKRQLNIEVLDGERAELVSVLVEGNEWTQYEAV
ncbi:hypothetical protein OH492_25575 [Vibrio chagasii]|nr:hypothetical protein [Vibrio chagasii]